MARWQAEQKGLPYQTYIKSLLHEALMARESAGQDLHSSGVLNPRFVGPFRAQHPDRMRRT
jgi:hypothetical protein